MTRPKRPDELARESAPEPTEPMYARRIAVGTVRHWRDAKGHGIITVPEVAPWDVWAHFSAVEGHGFRELRPGERVEVEFVRANQESFRYVAERVRRLDPPAT